jgi:Xaa-Pro aminopeptidase
VVVTPCEVPGAEREMLGFETLTFAPIDRTLVDTSLLSAAELAWLNAYHAEVRAVVGPQLDPATQSWLDAATAPI